MAIGGLIIGILCGATAALLGLSLGSGWLLALSVYAVFGSLGLIAALLQAGGLPED